MFNIMISFCVFCFLFWKWGYPFFVKKIEQKRRSIQISVAQCIDGIASTKKELEKTKKSLKNIDNVKEELAFETKNIIELYTQEQRQNFEKESAALKNFYKNKLRHDSELLRLKWQKNLNKRLCEFFLDHFKRL